METVPWPLDTGWLPISCFTLVCSARSVEVRHPRLLAAADKWVPLNSSNKYSYSRGSVAGSVRCSTGAIAPPRERISSVKRSKYGRDYEKLWRSLFSDPSQWWDYRSSKPSPGFPDFKHKETGQGLWLVDGRNFPSVALEIASTVSWLETEFVATLPNSEQNDLLALNKRIGGHVKAKEYKQAMETFNQMQQEGLDLDSYTFVPVLKACGGLRALEEGRRVHALAIQYGYDSDIRVCSSLIDMYSKCRRIEEAHAVFEKMTKHDMVSWTSMIVGYVKCGDGRKALELFQRMQQEGVEQNFVTFIGILNACAIEGALEEGRRVHEQIVQRGYESQVFISCSLVDMYAKCGSIEDAENVFNKMAVRNLVSWNAMIQGSVKCGKGQMALDLYRQMQREKVKPDHFTFVGVLNACAIVGDLEEGRQAHEQISKGGFESAPFIHSSLVDMYAKCGSIQDASRVFDSATAGDVGSWNAMISGCVKSGQGQKALDLYRKLQKQKVKPDAVTFVAVLNACASVAALWQGRVVHSQIEETGCEINEFVVTSLINMYAKCGCIEDAKRIFNGISYQSRSSWNAMLGGYAMYGYGKEALEHFEQMRQAGVEVDSLTLMSLLTACSHAGLVEEGLHHFESMSSVYKIPVKVEHYSCVVDLLARAGRLLEAENLIETMPCESNVMVWMSLLSGCRVHRNVQLGERAAKKVLELDSGNAAAYVLLSNIYGAAGKWDCKQKVHRLRLERGIKKEQGMTWIEINDEVHVFRAGDLIHPQIGAIRSKLTRLWQRMTELGYVPDLSSALHDSDDREKIRHLWSHSEKLAIALGLIWMPSPATPIRIYKNLRVCGDCHTAIKFISEIVGLEIILRDSTRFHCFKDGSCSCRDCW